jgi:hypothetical protein
MENNEVHSGEMVSYLYGDLNEDARNAFEERLFAEPDFSDQLDLVEDDLVDTYVRREMDASEQRTFENKYLNSPRRRSKVASARAIHSRNDGSLPPITGTEAEKSAGFFDSIFGFLTPGRLAFAGGLAALLIAAIVGIRWIGSNKQIDVVQNTNSGPEVDLPLVDGGNTNTEGQGPNNTVPDSNRTAPGRNSNDNNNQNQRPPDARKQEAPRVFAASLFPTMRSGTRPVIAVPGGAETVSLRAVGRFDGGYSRFVLELNDESGNTVWNGSVPNSSRAARSSVAASIPRSVFASGPYELAVSGVRPDGSVEELSFYNFIVRIK